MTVEVVLFPLVGIHVLVRVVKVGAVEWLAYLELVTRCHQVNEEPIGHRKSKNKGQDHQNHSEKPVLDLFVHTPRLWLQM